MDLQFPETSVFSAKTLPIFATRQSNSPKHGGREKFFGPQSNYTRLSTGVRGTGLTRSPTHFFRNPVKVKQGTVLQGRRFSFARSVTRCMGPKMNSEHPRKYGGKMPHAGEDGKENKLSSLFSFPRPLLSWSYSCFPGIMLLLVFLQYYLFGIPLKVDY